MVYVLKTVIADGRFGRPRRFVAKLTCLAFLIEVAMACGQSDSTESRAIKDTVSQFIVEAYSSSGDLDAAYALLHSSSQQSCPRLAFDRMALFGRDLARASAVKIERFKRIDVSEDQATIEIEVVAGERRLDFLDRVTLRRENDSWRNLITSDPSCRSEFDFFELGRARPGIVTGQEVTPVSEGDSSCDPSYPLNCIPKHPPKLDCSDVPFRNIIVFPPDPHDFDPDGNGWGCEE